VHAKPQIRPRCRSRQPIAQRSAHRLAPLYTQRGILADADPVERQWGIDAGLAWRAVAEASVVYTDHGISGGMAYGIEVARNAGAAVEYRKLIG
jgi:hypothetical protein